MMQAFQSRLKEECRYMAYRSRERVSEIDTFLAANYRDNGLDFCAKQLGEPRAYIMGRANYNKLTMSDKVSGRKKVEKKPTKKQIIEQLKRDNSILRKDNIRLAHINRTLKRGVIHGKVNN